VKAAGFGTQIGWSKVMKNPFLIGHNIYFRALEKEDAPVLVPWFNDPEVTRSLLVFRPLSRLQEEEFIAKANQDEHELTLGIALKSPDKLIGGIGLHGLDFRNRVAAFGIAIGDKLEWGKGYGTEATRVILQHAFESLNLNRVWLHVYEFNERGRRAYERVGFKKEGVLRQACFRDGRYWDAIVMGILREEWREVSSG
jgi:RimJ/RimL family protein N-acetyltransferase